MVPDDEVYVKIYPKVDYPEIAVSCFVRSCCRRYGGAVVLAQSYAEDGEGRYLSAILDREFVRNALGRELKEVPLVGDLLIVRDDQDDGSSPVDFRLPKELENIVRRIVIEPALERR